MDGGTILGAAWLAMILGIAFILPVVLWRADRRYRYRCWERMVQEQEQYVRDGCPYWTEGRYGGLALHHDPFMIDIGGIGPMSQFPDLEARDIAAGKQARIIRENRPRDAPVRVPFPVGCPGEVLGWCAYLRRTSHPGTSGDA